MIEEKNISLKSKDKTEWNNFMTYSGHKPDENALASYQKSFPETTLKNEHIPAALNEIAAIKSNPDHAPLLTPAYVSGGNLNYPVTKDGKHLEEVTGGNPLVGKPIPAPDYNNPQSRQQYAEQFSKKYGALMHGRGDTPLRINETPDSGTASAKELSTRAATKVGLDPATLYSSAMEEGMSGLFANKKGEVDYSGDEKHPISGYVSFGLDRFSDKFPELVKKGYLDKSFASKFVKSVEAPRQGDNKTSVNSANFATADDALMAKAAMVKDVQDTTESFAKKEGIKLSEPAKQFFTLVAYNGGEGNMKKMLKEYNDKGYLKNDEFINKRPSEGWAQIHENISRRLQMAAALKKEKLFD